MLYLDGSTRKQEDALGYWIDKENPKGISHLRFQSGYFAVNGLGAFSNIINSLNSNDDPISAVLGANERETIKDDVEDYLALIGSPRKNVRTAIVSFSNGLFHSKVYHLTRTDGSELAYVGSANLTEFGVNSGNIESGLIVDTRQGDPKAVLTQISGSIDVWFGGTAIGSTLVNTNADVNKLVADGIIGSVKPPRTKSGSGAKSSSGKKPPLKQLLNFGKISTKKKATKTTAKPAPITTTHAASGATTAAGGSTTSGQEILIAEIGAGVRWKQANFPQDTMKSYFGVNPLGGDRVTLHEVDSGGQVTDTVVTPVVKVKSMNYRIELRSVSGIAYPNSRRPIGVFRKTGTKEFRYSVFLPGDPGHSSLEAFLNANYAGAARQLKRVPTSASALNSVWPGCPV